MGGQHQPSPFFNRQLQRGKRLANPRVVSHHAFLPRHVEVDPNEDALPAQIQILNRQFIHYSVRLNLARPGTETEELTAATDDSSFHESPGTSQQSLKLRRQKLDQIPAPAGISPLVVVPPQHY